MATQVEKDQEYGRWEAFVDVLDRLEARNERLQATAERIYDTIGETPSWEYEGDEKTALFLEFWEDWSEEVPSIIRAAARYRKLSSFSGAEGTQWGLLRAGGPEGVKIDMDYFLRKSRYDLHDYPLRKLTVAQRHARYES